MDNKPDLDRYAVILFVIMPCMFGAIPIALFVVLLVGHEECSWDSMAPRPCYLGCIPASLGGTTHGPKLGLIPHQRS